MDNYINKINEILKNKNEENFTAKIFEVYKNSNQNVEIQNFILEIAKNNKFESFYFESDLEFYKKLKIEDIRKIAKQSLEDYISEPNIYLLKGNIRLVNALKSEIISRDEIKSIFNYVFKAIPNWEENFNKIEKEMEKEKNSKIEYQIKDEANKYFNSEKNEKNNLKFYEDIFNLYKISNQSENIKNLILDIAKKDIYLNKDSIFHVFFTSDEEIYKNIQNIKIEYSAEKSLERYNKNKNVDLLDACVDMAIMHIMPNFDTSEENKEAKKIWLNKFINVESFKVKLENGIYEMIKKNKEYEEKYEDYRKENQSEIVEIYQILVPAIFSHPKLINEEKMNQLINKITEDFNSFQIEEYWDNDCEKSSVVFDNGFLFTFEFNKNLSISEQNKFKEDILGQLSDGWGENASQKTMLIKQDVCSIDFDIDNASDFMLKNIDKNNKLKL